jgi:hypothetical protein
MVNSNHSIEYPIVSKIPLIATGAAALACFTIALSGNLAFTNLEELSKLISQLKFSVDRGYTASGVKQTLTNGFYLCGVVCAAFLLIKVLVTASTFWRASRRINQVPGGLVIQEFNSLSDLHILYTKMEPYVQRTVDIENRLEIMRKNPSCYLKLEERSLGETRVVGLAMVFILNQSACERVLKGTLTGYNITATDIALPNEKFFGFYIGFSWAADHDKRNKRFSAEVLRSTEQHIIALVNEAFPIKVFARPTNKEALRVLNRRGFKPIDPALAANEIGKVSMFELKGQLP